MTLDPRLIALLVCPVCKGPLILARDEHQRPTELVCPADRLGFPLRDGIPVMLETEARAVEATDPVLAQAPKPLPL
jgi:uncharacterized protein